MGRRAEVYPPDNSHALRQRRLGMSWLDFPGRKEMWVTADSDEGGSVLGRADGDDAASGAVHEGHARLPPVRLQQPHGAPPASHHPYRVKQDTALASHRSAGEVVARLLSTGSRGAPRDRISESALYGARSILLGCLGFCHHASPCSHPALQGCLAHKKTPPPRGPS